MKLRLSVLPKACLLALGLLSLLTQPYYSFAKPASTSFVYLPLILNEGSSSTPAPTTPPPPSSTPTTPAPPTNAYSLRFYGNGVNDIDRVKIPVIANNASLPVNIGAGDFTIEFWLRFAPNQNNSGPCTEGQDTWIYGNIIFDRDIFGTPDYGDFGISLYGNRIAFGVHNGSNGYTICSNATLSANTWHHVAVSRAAASGEMRIYINGQLSRQANGPSGNISYRVGRSITGNYFNEPYIVIGAEKHDYDPNTYPSFSGWIDEMRLSNTLRYTANFTPLLAPFTPDANTVGLYHFDEGSGTNVLDSSGASGGPSHGTRNFGGNPSGPVYDSNQKPF
jgi:hypothetical protein